MTEQEKLILLSEILEIELSKMTPTALLETFEEWDSLALISLIGMFSKHFAKKMSAQKLKEFKIVNDILLEMTKG